MNPAPEPMATTSAGAKQRAGTLTATAGFVLAVALAGYAWKGSPRLALESPATMADTSQPPDGAAPDQEQALAKMTALVEQLAAELQVRPNDLEGWTMLARSQAAIGRHADAERSYARAINLQPPASAALPDLLTDRADALARSRGRVLAGEPLKLIDEALRLDPRHLKALSLAGAAAFVKKDFHGALGHWEKLVEVGPPDSEFVRGMREPIAQAKRLAGLSPPGSGSADWAPASAIQPASAPATPTSVRGRVSVSAALAQQLAPDTTVFVSARAADGSSRMPLAVLRKQVGDLPFDFTLDDSLAMSPTAKLSSAPRVVVTARLSATGNALPRPEDLGARSLPVELGTKGIALEIAGPVER